MMRRLQFSIPIFYCILLAQAPLQFHLNDSARLNRFEHNSVKGQIANNAVIDIRYMVDSVYFFGTGNGLSFGELKANGEIDFGYFTNPQIPRGGNPALALNGSVIAVSGVVDTAISNSTEPMGTGIAYSKDGGDSWTYLQQPVDPDTVYFNDLNPGECVEKNYEWNSQLNTCFSNLNWTINWGGQEVSSLLASSEVDNVSYDLAIADNYIYAASWAGGVRRYPIGMVTENSPTPEWQAIPLPRDDDLDLFCGNIDSIYYLNPRDPGDGGNHNHKGFSVYVDEDTIWAGTAAGINKGIFNGDCIDWVGHYTSWLQNISGNWVIGITQQDYNEGNRIWAITWGADSQGEFSALSYTSDGGNTWETTMPSGHPEKVYNLFADSSHIWAASESGLYLSENGRHWEKYLRPIDSASDEELLAESVMSVYYSSPFNELWVGTGDGIGVSANNGITWKIYRFGESPIYNEPGKMFSVYPNPFLINDYNQVGGDGNVRFIYSNPENISGSIDIFNFAMDKVVRLSNAHLVNNNERRNI